MFRSLASIMLAGMVILSLTGCGEELGRAAVESQEKLRQAARSAGTLNGEILGFRQEMQKIRAQQIQWNESLNQLEARLNTIAQQNQSVLDSLSAVVSPAAAAAPTAAPSPEKTGWHWSVKLLLVLAIAVICYLVYKRLTREEEEEGELLDEGFLEENDFGSIRYPGKNRPEEENASARGKTPQGKTPPPASE